MQFESGSIEAMLLMNINLIYREQNPRCMPNFFCHEEVTVESLWTTILQQLCTELG